MYKIIPILLMFSCLYIFNANALDIESAIKYALNFSLDMSIEKNKLSISALERKKASIVSSPKANAGYNINANINDGSYNNSLALSASSTFSAAGIIDSRIASKTYEASLLGYNLACRKIAMNAIKKYMDILYFQDVFSLSKQTVKAMEESYRNVKARFDSGEASKADLSQSEANVMSARSKLIIAEGDMNSANASYERVFGKKLDNDEKFNIPTMGLVKEDSELDDFEVVKEIAIRNNIAIKQAMIAIEKANLYLKKEQLSAFPSLSASFSMSHSGELGSFSSEYKSAGVSVNVPIFRGGKEIFDFKIAKNNNENKNLEYKKVLLSVEEDLIKAYSDYMASKSRIYAAKKSVDSARSYVKNVKNSLAGGGKKLLDLLDAEKHLLNANVEMVDAIRDNVIAINSLKMIMGEEVYGV